MSRKTSVEWLTLIAGFSLFSVAGYAVLYELTPQVTLLSGLLVVLLVTLWVTERTPIFDKTDG